MFNRSPFNRTSFNHGGSRIIHAPPIHVVGGARVNVKVKATIHASTINAKGGASIKITARSRRRQLAKFNRAAFNRAPFNADRDELGRIHAPPIHVLGGARAKGHAKRIRRTGKLEAKAGTRVTATAHKVIRPPKIRATGGASVKSHAERLRHAAKLEAMGGATATAIARAVYRPSAIYALGGADIKAHAERLRHAAKLEAKGSSRIDAKARAIYHQPLIQALGGASVSIAPGVIYRVPAIVAIAGAQVGTLGHSILGARPISVAGGAYVRVLAGSVKEQSAEFLDRVMNPGDVFTVDACSFFAYLNSVVANEDFYPSDRKNWFTLNDKSISFTVKTNESDAQILVRLEYTPTWY